MLNLTEFYDVDESLSSERPPHISSVMMEDGR